MYLTNLNTMAKVLNICFGFTDDIIIIIPLCAILPEVSGCTKYFDDCGKNMSLKIEDDNIFKIL